MWDCLLDALLDTLKLMPFLFAAYLIIEFAEHKGGDKMYSALRKYGRIGPLIGGLLGLVPSCGFSVGTASIYSGGLVTFGTLAAVFITTFDDALPILAASLIPAKDLATIILVKLGVGIVLGFALDFIIKNKHTVHSRHDLVHKGCHDHCSKHGIFMASLEHTLRSSGLVFATLAVLEIIIYFIGDDAIRSIFSTAPFVQVIAAVIIGFIPGCTPSIVLSELYVEGVIGIGPLTAGLTSVTGLGMVELIKSSKSKKEVLVMAGVLAGAGLITGLILI
ncbi:MAG: putative manganese transporter [Oscillospiraceae bacterium]|jgi:hypothetical protein